DILFGADDAATRYLERTTSAQLTRAFRPIIRERLQEVNAATLWNQVFTRYNQLPMTKKVNPDLDGYVTDRALNGLFLSIAQEEKKIRENPLHRGTDLLKKVFGYRDRKTSNYVIGAYFRKKRGHLVPVRSVHRDFQIPGFNDRFEENYMPPRIVGQCVVPRFSPGKTTQAPLDSDILCVS